MCEPFLLRWYFLSPLRHPQTGEMLQRVDLLSCALCRDSESTKSGAFKESNGNVCGGRTDGWDQPRWGVRGQCYILFYCNANVSFLTGYISFRFDLKRPHIVWNSHFKCFIRSLGLIFQENSRLTESYWKKIHSDLTSLFKA